MVAHMRVEDSPEWHLLIRQVFRQFSGSFQLQNQPIQSFHLIHTYIQMRHSSTIDRYRRECVSLWAPSLVWNSLLKVLLNLREFSWLDEKSHFKAYIYIYEWGIWILWHVLDNFLWFVTLNVRTIYLRSAIEEDLLLFLVSCQLKYCKKKVNSSIKRWLSGCNWMMRKILHGWSVIILKVHKKPAHSANLHVLMIYMVGFVLFCFVVMRSTEPGCFRSCSWCRWKALDEEAGCIGFGSMPFGLAVQKFLNIEWFFHWKLN